MGLLCRVPECTARMVELGLAERLAALLDCASGPACAPWPRSAAALVLCHLLTASPEAKRALLRAQGVEHVFNSRDTDFAAQVMKVTDGHGADVALNSLSGDFIDATVECLAETGRLVVIARSAVG